MQQRDVVKLRNNYVLEDSRGSKTDMCDFQIPNWRWQLFKYNIVIFILIQGKQFSIELKNVYFISEKSAI